MNIKKYIKKPVVIEALQWTGRNKDEIRKFIKGKRNFYFKDNFLYIKTLEGDLIANEGDFIIKGIKGEFYPCKPDIFKETYKEIKYD